MASGLDDIHYQLLKHLSSPYLHTLLALMNEVWATGNVPSIWKTALVVPVPKPGKDHTVPSKYCRIALTSCVYKTMERMVNDRLVWFLEKHTCSLTFSVVLGKAEVLLTI